MKLIQSPIGDFSVLSYSLCQLLGSFTVLNSIRIPSSVAFCPFSFLASLLFKSNEFLQSYIEWLLSLVQTQIFGWLPKCLIIYCSHKENSFLRGMMVCGSDRSLLSSLCIPIRLFLFESLLTERAHRVSCATSATILHYKLSNPENEKTATTICFP